MSDPAPDVAVVGAGLVGAACAYWAALEGLTVVGCERAGIGDGTTATGMGHILALDQPPSLLALCRYSQRLWHELAPRLPPAVAFRSAGTLWLARSAEDLAVGEKKRERLTAAGLPVEVLDATGARALEPALGPGLIGALRVPEDALLDPPAAARYLWEEAVRHGARIERERPVCRIGPGTVERADGSILRAREVVNAAGVDAPSLSPQLAISPRKGHLVRLPQTAPPISHALVDLGYGRSVASSEPVAVAFNAQPQPNGTVLLGASRETGVADRIPDPAIVARLRETARAFVPSLALGAPLEVRTGLRPSSPDHLPYIGRLPGSDGLWVAAGHEGFGVTASLGTGRLLVDLLLGRSPAISAAPYALRPERLSGRSV